MIPHAQALALRDKVACDALEIIARDREKLRGKVRKSVEFLETHLFSPDLTVSRLRRACGTRDNSFSTAFRHALGMPPTLYIRQHRFTVAAQLLMETEMPMWQVAEMVGYSSPDTFSEGFQSWSGLRPRVYRERQRERPEQPRSPAPADFRIGLLWEKCKAWSYEDQLALFRQQQEFPDPQLFEFLKEKSLEAVRCDRELGLQVARVAVEAVSTFNRCTDLDSLFASPPPLHFPEIVALQARAWAWLGNARRLVLDYPGAERAFNIAAFFLQTLPDDTAAYAEFCELKASLYLYQEHYSEAVVLTRQAVRIFRQQGDPKALGEALILLGTIAQYQEEFELALECFREVSDTLDPVQFAYLSFVSAFQIVNCHEKAGQYERAAQLLPRVQKLMSVPEAQSRLPFLAWLEGRILLGKHELTKAEERLLDARDAFLMQAQAAHAAAACLDLALIAAYHGDTEKTICRTVQVIPLFEAYSRPETLLALQLLHTALDRQSVDISLLQQLKTTVEQLRRDPTVNL